MKISLNSRTAAVAGLAGAICLSICMVGCSTLPTVPFLEPGPRDADEAVPSHDTLNVSNLVEHINCQIQHSIALVLDNAAMETDAKGNKSYSTQAVRYARLIEDNFIAVIDLNVKVTNAELFSPSLSFINPLKASGTNFTFGLGGQLGGSQDRNFDFNYTVDVSRLALSKDVENAKDIVQNIPTKLVPKGSKLLKDTACTADRPNNDPAQSSIYAKIDNTGIAGDLGLTDIIDNGLDVMDASAPYSLFGSKGPLPGGDFIPVSSGNQILPRSLASAEVKSRQYAEQLDTFALQSQNNSPLSKRQINLARTNLDNLSRTAKRLAPYSNALSGKTISAIQKVQPALNSLAANNAFGLARGAETAIKTTSPLVAAKPNGSSPPANAADKEKATVPPPNTASNKFASQVDFNITLAANSTPSWTLKYFKGPSTSGSC